MTKTFRLPIRLSCARDVGQNLAGGRVASRPQIGLGDLVWSFLHPIAAWLDRRRVLDPALGLALRLIARMGWASLPLATCPRCSKRRAWLNWLLPDLRSWACWQALFRRLAGPRQRP